MPHALGRGGLQVCTAGGPCPGRGPGGEAGACWRSEPWGVWAPLQGLLLTLCGHVCVCVCVCGLGQVAEPL